MANPFRGQVEVELGDQTRVLRLDLNGVADLETRLGQSVGSMFKDPGIKVIRETLYVALTSNKRYRNITVKQIGTWMHKAINEGDRTLEYFGDAVGQLVQMALGGQQDEEATEESPLEAETAGVKLASG